MSSPPVSLCTLPEELLLRILEFAAEHRYLPRPWSSNPILHLSSTCRLLHRLALPFLYSHLNFQLVHPLRFLLTIARSPHLRPLVKRIKWRYQTNRDVAQRFPFSGDERQELAFGVHWQELGTPFAMELSTALEGLDERCEQYLAALLMFTPNVERLDIVDRLDSDSHRYWLDPIRFGTPHPFRHLKSAKIVTGWMHLKQLVPLFLLPLMKEVHLTELAQPEDEDFLTTMPGRPYSTSYLPSGVSNVEVLKMRDGYVDSRVVKALLGLFKKLRAFECEFDTAHFGRERFTVDENYTFGTALHYPTIFEGLGGHKDTLDHLGFFDNEFGPLDTALPFPPLHDFKSLNSLHITFTRLVSGRRNIDLAAFEAIPDHIEEMELTFVAWDNKEHAVRFREGLEVLARDGKRRFQMLKKVRVSGPWRIHMLHVSDWEELKGLYEENGMEFEVDEYGIVVEEGEVH